MNRVKRFSALLLAIAIMASLLCMSASAYSTIKKGSQGSDVKVLQALLNKYYSSGLNVDGIFGSGTQTAVKNFQKSNNLTADGIVGAKSWAALEKKNGGSTLVILSGNYAPGTLGKGKSYSINGLVLSANKIASLTVGIYTTSGSGVQTQTVKPNAKEYNISKLDSKIKFGSLAVGTYRFKVIAKDSNGVQKTLVNNQFKITTSQLKIGTGNYNPGTLTLKKSYSLKGEITSTSKITFVEVGIFYKSGKPTMQVASANPNATAYNISKLDGKIKFGILIPGTYYLKISAKNSDGLKVLVNNKFTVTTTLYDSTVTAKLQYALDNWIAPVKASYSDPTGGARYFGASRDSGSRSHAGMDYVVTKDTPIYAMDDGVVQSYNTGFYCGTDALVVKHSNGMIARYGEIRSNLRKGDTVKKGQQIGTIIANTSKEKSRMLHLELFLGTVSGNLTQSGTRTYKYTNVAKNFNRRSDLLDPMFLLNLPKER